MHLLADAAGHVQGGLEVGAGGDRVASLAKTQLCRCLSKPRFPVTLRAAFCVGEFRKLLLSLALEKSQG